MKQYRFGAYLVDQNLRRIRILGEFVPWQFSGHRGKFKWSVCFCQRLSLVRHLAANYTRIVVNLRCTASRQIDESPASLIGFVVVGEFRGQALHQPRLERLFPVAQWPAASPLHDRPESLCEAWRAIGRRRNGAEGRLGADGRETDGIDGSG